MTDAPTTASMRSKVLAPDLIPSLLVAAAVIVLDQITKYWAHTYLRNNPSVEVLGDWFKFTYTYNTGSAFGFFQNGNAALTVIALIVPPLLIIFRRHLPVSGRTGEIVLGLLVGGAIGNLIDRIRLGYVIDFIDMGVGTMRWFTYNIADSAFVIGATLMVILSLFQPNPQHTQPVEARNAKRS